MTMTTAARALVAAALLVLPVIDGLASPYATLRAATVVDPRDGSVASPLDGLGPRSVCVVVENDAIGKAHRDPTAVEIARGVLLRREGAARV